MRGSVHRRVERIVSCDPEAVRAEIMHGVLASFRRGEVGDLRANLTTVLREQDYTVQKLARYTMDLRRISPKRYRGLLKDARHTVSTSAEALSSETAKVVAGSSAALGSAERFHRYVKEANALKVYNLAFQLGQRCQSHIAAKNLAAAVPVFRSLQRVVSALTVRPTASTARHRSLDDLLSSAYDRLEASFKSEIVRLIDNLSLKVDTEAETIGNDLLKVAEREWTAKHRRGGGARAHSGGEASLRDSSWAKEQNRRRRRSLSVQEAVLASTASVAIERAALNDPYKAMFREEIVALEHFFSLYTVVGSRAMAVQEYRKRLKLTLSQMASDLDLHSLGESYFLKGVMVLAKRIVYHFALEDTIQRSFRFYFLNETDVFRKWERCEKEFAQYIKRGLQSLPHYDFNVIEIVKRQVYALVECASKFHFFRFANVRKHGRPCRELRRVLFDFRGRISACAGGHLTDSLALILKQSGVVGGMHITSAEEFEALVVPFGLDVGKGGVAARTFPVVMPFSKKVTECAIAIQRVRNKCMSFMYDPLRRRQEGDADPLVQGQEDAARRQELHTLSWETTWGGLECCLEHLQSVCVQAKERAHGSLSVATQAAVDASFFPYLIGEERARMVAECREGHPTDGNDVGADLSGRIDALAKQFEMTAIHLQDEIVQILCEETRAVISDVMVHVKLNSKHKSNSILTVFAPLIDFLSTSYVNLMNFPKVKRDAAMYLSMQQISSYIMDVLLDDDHTAGCTKHGLFNVSLALAAVEKFAASQDCEDLDKIFVPLRNELEDQVSACKY
jgi:hypothetical protein